MIQTLAIILGFQLTGEVLSRALSLPLPGPVTGLVLLVLACILRPALAEAIRPVTQGLLAHLSLFFVPAGVGIVAHWDLLRDQGLGLAVALMGSTLLAIAAGAWAFTAVARLTGSEEREALRDQGRE
ncbi:CidA/LrgA family protein [Paracoccus aestuarii]|uniref:CidA/LrgA family protein n=1 Tax=Paracoccus aestuarii TaxID=453842 RepID=A0A419A0R2_9RHOB|nr:CidA/LrgA family protein [Paracoccus aestuarii]RJL06517.1 CidA/LrgA family protein [Paracoccus aestuarii]WCQ98823.1 CidA/LrgA family protein [Paracoccus aestuarii]